nr:hypothetical protein [Salipaludibacillus daqingensis]
MKDYHCCATCIHFVPLKTNHRTKFYCARLRFETKSHYQFNCWEPKEHIQRLINKEERASQK